MNPATVFMSETRMHHSKIAMVDSNWKYRVPHQAKPMKGQEIAKYFPVFAGEMDGMEECCFMDYFYELDKTTGIFEFKDETARIELAELFEKQLLPEEEYVIPKDKYMVKPTSDEIVSIRTHIADIRRGHDLIGR